MSANPPIRTFPSQPPRPDEHLLRYLLSVQPHQQDHIHEGHRKFATLRKDPRVEEVPSYWANGDSSSLGKWSEIMMGRRARARSSPPRLTYMEARMLDPSIPQGRWHEGAVSRREAEQRPSRGAHRLEGKSELESDSETSSARSEFIS